MMSEFLKKHRLYIIISFLFLILATLALIVFSSGPQKTPFIYQVQ